MMWFLLVTLAAMTAVSYVDASVDVLNYSPVIFSVGKTRKTELVRGEIVKYEQVLINVGGGYNPRTGIFTSPVDGAYVFSFNVLVTPDHQMFLSLYKNSDQVASIRGSETSLYASGGNSVIIPLKKGDTVYIKSRKDVELYASLTETYATFSGYNMPFV